MFDLNNKTVFMTGGSSGIGLAVATRFSQAGARVAIADITGDEEVAESLGGRFFQVDVSNEDDVRAALDATVDWVGKLDVLINNAGIVGADNNKSIAEGDHRHFSQIIDVNLKGVFYGLKHGPARMRDGGSIINTSSMAAVHGSAGYSQYAATKAGVLALTRAAALELGGRGIRVNAVCPTYIRTALGGGAKGEAIARTLGALGRIGEVEDLVGVYHFLAADESSLITGQAINVDGGMSAGKAPEMIRLITQSVENQ